MIGDMKDIGKAVATYIKINEVYTCTIELGGPVEKKSKDRD